MMTGRFHFAIILAIAVNAVPAAAETTQSAIARSEAETAAQKGKQAATAAGQATESGLKAAAYKSGELLRKAGDKLGPVTDKVVEKTKDAAVVVKKELSSSGEVVLDKTAHGLKRTGELLEHRNHPTTGTRE